MDEQIYLDNPTSFYSLLHRSSFRVHRLISVCPADEDGADRVARADGGQYDEAPFFQPPIVKRVSHSERDRRGGGVAEFMNVFDHLLLIKPKFFSRRIDYAEVRLMGDKQIHVLAGEAVPL